MGMTIDNNMSNTIKEHWEIRKVLRVKLYSKFIDINVIHGHAQTARGKQAEEVYDSLV